MEYTNPSGATFEIPGYMDPLQMSADFKAFADSLPDLGPIDVVAINGNRYVTDVDDSKLFTAPGNVTLTLAAGLPAGFQVAAWSPAGTITIEGSETIAAETQIPPNVVGIATKVKA